MAKRNSVPNRVQNTAKREKKFIDMPKDKLIKLCVGLAAVILVIVLAFVLVDKLDGHLPVQDGVVVTEGDNVIVVNNGTLSNPRYFKLGQAGEVEGYTLSRLEDLVNDDNVAPFGYEPQDEASLVSRVTINPAVGDYKQVAQDRQSQFAQFLPNAQAGEVTEITAGGHPAYGFGMDYNYDNAQMGEGEGFTFVRDYYACVKAGKGCVMVYASSEAPEEAGLADQETLIQAVNDVAAKLTVE